MKVKRNSVTILMIAILFVLNVATGFGVYAGVDIHEENNGIQFDDTIAHWAKQEISFMVKMGITKGVDSKHYAPEDNITRAEFLTMVMRGIKIAAVPYQGIYSDVNANDWFADTVQAAADAGIIDQGVLQDGKFVPNIAISRQEMTSVVINAYSYVTGKEVQGTSIESFEDYNQISEWAVPFVKAANELGIIKGVTSKRFAPYDNATRAQAAVIIKRLLQAANLINIEEDSINFLTSQKLGTLRNNFSGWVGAKITIGNSDLKVTELGRLFVAGNTQSHKVKIVVAAIGEDLAGSEVTVNMAGGSEGKFVYSKLSTPVLLNANTTYYIVSMETKGGDQWGNADTLATSEVARIDCGMYQSSKWTSGGQLGQMFGPLDFKCISTGINSLGTTSVPSVEGLPFESMPAPQVGGKEYLSHASVTDQKGNTEEFDFTLWLPEDSKTVKGIYIVITHGYGAQLVNNNAFRNMIQKQNCAMVYFLSQTIKNFNNQETCANVIFDALKDFSNQSEHPELEFAPLATWGHSNGSQFAARFAAYKPERFFSMTAYKSAHGRQFELPEIKNVPTQIVCGELDKEYGNNGQLSSMENLRSVGALIHYAVDPGAGHFPMEDKSNSFCFAFMEKAFQLRVPADADPTKGLVELMVIPESSGWLGNNETKEIASYSSYSVDKSTASWFFDETFAKQWKEFVTTGVVKGISLN